LLRRAGAANPIAVSVRAVPRLDAVRRKKAMQRHAFGAFVDFNRMAA
jgi:hypothetical protein